MDLRFPGRDADNPDVVVITGDEDAVAECKDHLLQLEDEFVCSCHRVVVVVVVVLVVVPKWLTLNDVMAVTLCYHHHHQKLRT